MPIKPGIVFTPAFWANFFDLILSPMLSIAFAGGPIKVTPSTLRASANILFSERNPYPGCTASAPVLRTASITFSITRYESFAGD